MKELLQLILAGMIMFVIPAMAIVFLGLALGSETHQPLVDCQIKNGHLVCNNGQEFSCPGGIERNNLRRWGR